MTYKCLNKLVPNYLCQKFVTRSDISNHVTRQNRQLHKPLYTTSKTQKSFLYRTATIWNNPGDFLEFSTTVKSFKYNLNKKLPMQLLDES